MLKSVFDTIVAHKWVESRHGLEVQLWNKLSIGVYKGTVVFS
jgi:hypothetical protein